MSARKIWPAWYITVMESLSKSKRPLFFFRMQFSVIIKDIFLKGDQFYFSNILLVFYKKIVIICNVIVPMFNCFFDIYFYVFFILDTSCILWCIFCKMICYMSKSVLSNLNVYELFYIKVLVWSRYLSTKYVLMTHSIKFAVAV